MLVATVTGCVGQGRLYTRVVKPLSVNFQNTPAGSKVCAVDEYAIREPISGAGLSVTLTWRAAQEAAYKAGITNLYYADLETLSLLNGIYKKQTIFLYGD